MTTSAFTADETQALVDSLDGWRVGEDGKGIEKTFEFADFNEAFGFMCRAALVAEKHDHHPEWFNVYKTVKVRLSTHDVDGVSERDGALARAMDRIAG